MEKENDTIKVTTTYGYVGRKDGPAVFVSSVPMPKTLARVGRLQRLRWWFVRLVRL